MSRCFLVKKLENGSCDIVVVTEEQLEQDRKLKMIEDVAFFKELYSHHNPHIMICNGCDYCLSDLFLYGEETISEEHVIINKEPMKVNKEPMKVNNPSKYRKIFNFL